jgi:imidazolonepropionase-like amidohydrolase
MMLPRPFRFQVLACVLLVLLFAAWRAGGQNSATPLVIEHVTVVDSSGKSPVAGSRVTIHSGRIAAVGLAAGPLPQGARVVDGRGKYLVPGLWDMHVHLDMVGPSALGLLVANGVTGVRDLGGDFAQVRAMRDQVNRGALIGPRIRTAGTILETPRFLGVLRMLAGQLEEPFDEALEGMAGERIAVATPEAARAAVAKLADAGADCIKFRSVVSLEVLRALAEEASRHGLVLVGHTPAGISAAEAAEAGQRSFEHSLVHPGSLEIEDEAAMIERLRRAEAVVVPTLVTVQASRLLSAEEQRARIDDVRGRLDARRRYVSEELLAHWRLQMRLDEFESPADWREHHEASLELLQRLHRAGVTILPGTDLGARFIYPGWSLHDELELLVSEVGMTPAEALQAATLLPARHFGIEDELGTVEPGKRADLVLLDASPLESIANTRRIRAVVLGGRYLDSRALRRLREDAVRSPTP